MLYNLEGSNGKIPSRSDIKDIEVDSNSFVSLVSCDTLELISSRSQCGLGVSLHPEAVERHINASSQGESGR